MASWTVGRSRAVVAVALVIALMVPEFPASAAARTTPGTFAGVSCPSTTFCVAVGAKAGSALVDMRRSTTWTVTSVPLPSGQTRLDSVSCATVSACVAVGYKYKSGSSFSEIWNGSSWKLTGIAAPPAPEAAPELVSVSCPQADYCVATGTDSDQYRDPEVFSETWNGTAWSAAPVGQPLAGGNSYGYSVSCAATTSCFLVGQYSSGPGDYLRPFSEEWNGTAWSFVATAATPHIPGILNSVSCRSAAYCLAGGQVSLGDDLAEVWGGSSWSATTPAALTSPLAVFNGTSCASTSWCMSVGDRYVNDSSTDTTSIAAYRQGTTWTVAAPVAPTGASSHEMTAVSCVTTSFCLAVGYATVASAQQRVVEKWTGSGWILGQS